MARRLKDYNAQATAGNGRPSYRGAVISIHGMKTTGGWQKEIGPLLQDAGMRYAAVDYGWRMLSVLRPLSGRTARRAWKAIEAKHQEQQAFTKRIGVIAHSFGTYCFGTFVEAKTSYQFGNVILCASILPRAFDWKAAQGRGQITR